MTRRSSYSGSRPWRLAVIGALALLGLFAPTARAQSTTDTTDPNAQEPVKAKRAGTFQLFGLADFAITGMRQGGRTSWKTTASGPSDDFPTLDADLPGRVIGTAVSPNGYCCGYFELQLWMAAGRTDWSRARDVIPSLENVKGGGWNARTQLSRWVSDQRLLSFTGRDGSIGELFSGVTSTDGDGSCRDNNARANSFIGKGMQLLAGSDCPPTWANPARFDGERVVPDTMWVRRFVEQGSDFRFDDHQFGPSERDDARLYGAFQTFGATNDFGKERIADMGNVIPGGAGSTDLEGYPMGVEWQWQAWSYAVPSLADAMFYKATIVNRSDRVYGTAIDYDSLFLGFMVRPFHTTGTQSPAVYAALERGAVLSAQGNVNNTNCYGPPGGNRKGMTTLRACPSLTDANRGYRGGAGALVVLKSPVGDLRNKLFTRPGSKFYMPTHPAAGDTFTYNIMTSCGFTCATSQITVNRVRASYGAIVGSELDALAGRGITSSDFTSDGAYHNLFRNPDMPVRWSPGTGSAGGFARYLPPGNWDYDHDGVLDTMKVTTCWTSSTTPGWTGTAVDGCVPPFADTLPGGFPNSFHNNYFIGAGASKLHARDTLEYVVAFVSAPDSIALERQVTNIIQLYENFWLSPQPPAPVQIVSASVVGGSRLYDTEVRLFFDQTSNEQSDAFLLQTAARLKASNDAADVRLRVLNPSLVANILARALPAGRTVVDTVPRTTTQANVDFCRSAGADTINCRFVSARTVGVVDSLLIFKSCDGGITFTASTGTACIPSPARDVVGSAPSGYQWQSYARLGRDAAGRFPSQYRDGAVTAGVTYTYVVVAQSFPASFQVVDSVGGTIVSREYVVRPKTQNGLTANTANRNVATVYVPASTQAGSLAAGVAFQGLVIPGVVARDTSSAVLASFRLSKPLPGTADIPGRAIFSDSAEVRIYDSDTTAAGIDSTVVRLFQIVPDSVRGTTVGRYAAGREERFVIPGSAGSVDLGIRSLGTTVIRVDSAFGGSSAGKAVIYRYRRNTVNNRPQVTLVLNGQPVYVTDSLPTTTDITPGSTTARPDFIGALLNLDVTRAAALAATYWRAPGIPLLAAAGSPTIGWLPGTARDTAAFSRYRFDWQDTEFGPYAPFIYNHLDPDTTRRAYTASLAARRTASTTATDSAAAAAIARATGRAITADSLAALDMPFTVSNLRFGRPVRVAVLKSDHIKSAVFGTASDTVRVTVPADKWVPGDPMYFIESVPSLRYDTIPATSPVVRLVHRTNGIPDTITVEKVTWGTTRLGCGLATCNPITGIGGSGYTLARNGLQFEVQYYSPLGGLGEIQFTLRPDRAGNQIASLREGDLGLVGVVPNPYIMYSQFEQTAGTKRLMFVGLPPRGTIRIYTASGQFVQQIKWTETDLTRNCRATTVSSECIETGDLQWNMRTHEDREIGPGFYVYVVSTNVGGGKKEKLGKFVIIH